ncbi:hypothetical protein [Lactobacillus sp. UCMA15818]|uniref:hypothetical protein n=1 Tax=Lactobacillaceae TaxID=33958 RepID=UPI0025AF1BDB|nr:hypothetical protein [Lactobacillus sp. UCMA15818]MDN2452787.1 hypothetical protein [Lactobacillus sp. UCMA15818]
MQKLHLTFGSSYVIENIKAQNKGKKFFQFTGESNPQQHALMTIDYEKEFFKSNLNYSILNGNLDIIKETPYFFSHFSLDEKQQKIYLATLQHVPAESLSFLFCQSLNHDFDFLVISCWATTAQYKNWLTQYNFITTSDDSSTSSYSRKMHIDS